MTLHPQTKRQVARRAFTLMEMLIVVAIIVVLAGLGTYYVLPQLQKAKEDAARVGAINVEKALMTYQGNNDTYPPDLQTLTQKDQNGHGPYIQPEGLLDPWGKQYQFDPQGTHFSGAKPDVYTVSPSGRQISNWGKK